MRLLVIRHAIAMKRDEFQVAARKSDAVTAAAVAFANGKGRESARAGDESEARTASTLKSATEQVPRSSTRKVASLDWSRLQEADDDLRPLTIEGIRKMRKNSKGLRDLVGSPDLLVTSPLTRALQTVEVLNGVWKDVPHAVCDQLRPGSEPADLARWLSSREEAGRRNPLIAIVGHEPHLSTVTSWFLAGESRSLVELKKGGACLLEFARGFDRARGKLLWLATPKLLQAVPGS